MIGWGEDKEFDMQGTIKKLVIGLVFAIAVPLVIASALDIDVIKGCALVTEVEDGSSLEIGDCKRIGDEAEKEGIAKDILSGIDEYLPLGMRLLLLGLVVAMFLGPGWKILKHEIGCTRHI